MVITLQNGLQEQWLQPQSRGDSFMWDLMKYSKNIAVIDDLGIEVTYGEIAKMGEEIRKVAGRCLVVSLCSNTIGSVAGYLSFLNNHIVPIMLNMHMEQELLGQLLKVYSPSYIWCPENEVRNHADFTDMKTVYSAYGYSLLETGYGMEYHLYSELALLLTTSGSTGSPKFVRQSYGNIKANIDSIVSYLGIDEAERPITTLPMNYTYGLSIINSHVMVGATILVTDKSLMQKEFWSFLKEKRATSFGGVPYTYEMLDRLRFTRMELPYLKTMTQAGGRLTPELHAKFAAYAAEQGKSFVVMYGQCEATARMGYLPAEKAVEKCGSMGIAIPGGHFQLIDENGKTVTKPYVTGELVYQGENVTLGYAECGKDLGLGDERNGVLQTGDMAQFDEDGYYYIVGRKKRFLKIYGNRVNLDEMERMIKGAFDGIDCACAGVDDHMYIFLTDNGKLEEIKHFVVNKIKLNPIAFRFVVVNEIFKNEAGKVLYRELEQYYEC